MKNILIIAYQFPPMGGVGTRRWAKFAKYLKRAGHEVYVLHAHYPYRDIPNWEGDVKDIRREVFYSRYPLKLIKYLEQKKFYTFLRILQYGLGKTLFFRDKAQHDARQILKKAKTIISNYNIDNVIATGHPVSVNYFASFLKTDHPHIHLIQDFRDNWNDLETFSYPAGFPFFWQKEASVRQEMLTVGFADKILNVSDDSTKMMQARYALNAQKMITLHNGYDPEDYEEILKKKIRTKTFSFIYAGSLYNKRIEAIHMLLDAINLLPPNAKKQFQLTLYTNYPPQRLDPKYRHLLGNTIHFHPFVPHGELLTAIASHQYCLSINARFAPYAYATKVVDYMAMRKPILHISEGGALSDMLKNAEQFTAGYNPDEVYTALEKLWNLREEQINISSFESFSLQNLTLTLEKCLA